MKTKMTPREKTVREIEKEFGLKNFFMPAFKNYESKRLKAVSYTPAKISKPKNFFDIVEGVIEGYPMELMGR